MRFETLNCPTCGEVARGTCETLVGTALLVHNEDGSSEWEGETIIHWDGQQTDTRDGMIVLDCDGGHEWTSRELD
jgi:hypothetical protein